jgi:hypothetical protein
MVVRLDKAQLLARSEVVPAPAAQAWQDYTFELPPALHFATGALFIGFVSVLSLAFANPEMAVPFGIFIAFIGAFFAVPAIFVRSAPEGSARARRWADFMEKGVAVEHGRCTGREASILVLMLPVLIFCWALAIATIATLV